MRQVFFQKPWIYLEEPKPLREIYYRYGVFESLKRGAPLQNGGANGRFYYLKKGLASFSFCDKNGRSFIFSLVLPGRALADIDGLSRELVNVKDMVIRPSEVLSIDYDTWKKYIANDPQLMLLYTKGIISKEETHMEAMIANYTLSVADRVLVFMKSLILSFQSEIINGWNSMPIYLSHGEYAQIIGASRITVSRVIMDFFEKGYIKKINRDMAVHSNLLKGIYDWTDGQSFRA